MNKLILFFAILFAIVATAQAATPSMYIDGLTIYLDYPDAPVDTSMTHARLNNLFDAVI